MTYTEILELIRAGYKRDEIEAMMAAESKAPASEPEQQLNQEPEQKIETPEPKQDEKQPETQQQSEAEKLAVALGLKLDNLTRAIQAHNVNSLEGNGSTGDTVDSILARIINPHIGEVK